MTDEYKIPPDAPSTPEEQEAYDRFVFLGTIRPPKTWDVFAAYRQYGGWANIAQYIYVLQPPGEATEVVLAKSNVLHEIGEQVGVGYDPQYGSAYVTVAPGTNTILRRISRDDFDLTHFDLRFAVNDPLLIAAVGEFMCGSNLHGQWFSGLLTHMAVCLADPPKSRLTRLAELHALRHR